MAKTDNESDVKLVIEENEFFKYLFRAHTEGIMLGWNANTQDVRRIEPLQYEKFLEFISKYLPHYKITKKKVKRWYARKPEPLKPQEDSAGPSAAPWYARR